MRVAHIPKDPFSGNKGGLRAVQAAGRVKEPGWPSPLGRGLTREDQYHQGETHVCSVGDPLFFLRRFYENI